MLSTIGEVRVRAMANAWSAADSGARPWDILAELGPVGTGARPVVIQGGLSTDAYLYDPVRRMLADRGFDVSATSLDYHGFGSLRQDATNLASVVQSASQRSIAAGGDGLVSVVAHSKGGLAARWYLQRMDGVEHVAQLVTLGTPHNGVAPYGSRITGLAARLPGIQALKQLTVGNAAVRELNDGIGEFMDATRAARPDFRIVSIAGNLDLPVMRATDGVVSNAASALDDSIAGLHNLVLRGAGAHHGAIAGQVGMFKPALLAATEVLAQRPVPDAFRGAIQLTA